MNNYKQLWTIINNFERCQTTLNDVKQLWTISNNYYSDYKTDINNDKMITTRTIKVWILSSNNMNNYKVRNASLLRLSFKNVVQVLKIPNTFDFYIIVLTNFVILSGLARPKWSMPLSTRTCLTLPITYKSCTRPSFQPSQRTSKAKPFQRFSAQTSHR